MKSEVNEVEGRTIINVESLYSSALVFQNEGLVFKNEVGSS